ncbi:MAG: methylmalonyl-CoA mutase [Chloroflexi bacterium CG_4_9_14_3_um_filter_45_9]|nr:MAG: methylmalonyl-CoA mutase [Dehalococcoidia bacterium CG2_30_46_9]PIU23459.1 MAG: methylmalonyl-CoA mutase [Chloroflexi bacterium CG08_land_8_20_14_0_20_45_12]PIX27333.1 MAG: methylmalonyl-CoA mutase [Chloroflexi bacterium CG_4_8_14_3_um_filter_45_15]PJB49028.1 MAG: methylmalonyl-CoA mutase [Chloroflexi bacterium CG_4_9_14_3_um_filter_45_9]
MTSKTKQEWREGCLAPVIKRSPERQDKFETTSGIELDTVYTPEDLVDFRYVRDLGYPGEYPFTRGVQPNMYRGRIWTIRQYAGFGSAEETNQRYRYLLEQGQTGLSVAFDLPTQIGYDSDYPQAKGEVGKVGVAIDSLQDIETLFQGIPLGKVSTSMTINATAPVLLAMYIALGKKQGVDPSKLEGTVQNDILKEYIARGTHIFPPRPSMRLTTDIFAYCAKNIPRWNTISISGYHIREAGSTAAQEIGFTLANGIAYAKAAIDAGLEVDSFAPRLSFFFNSHVNFFEEIAKFRAARRLWAKIMKERFGAKDSRSWMLRFHTQTAGCSLTAQQPYNNIVRTTLQGLAATLGSTQSLHTNSFDEAYAPPSEEAVTVAVRTQQILAHENDIGNVVDPLGGSYYIEYLTNELENKASEYIAKIDNLGGAVVAIEQGYQQREIQDASYSYQREVESGQRAVVGVNKFVSPYPKITGLIRVKPEVEKRQRERLAQLKKERDNSKVSQTLRCLEDVARGKDNTMPAFLECVEAYATLGEICDVLRKIFGTQREFLVF